MKERRAPLNPSTTEIAKSSCAGAFPLIAIDPAAMTKYRTSSTGRMIRSRAKAIVSPRTTNPLAVSRVGKHKAKKDIANMAAIQADAMDIISICLTR
jgi:hypothetical protein